MAVTVLKHIKEAKNRAASAHLKNAIRYIVNPKKTENGLWVGGNVGTDPQEAFEAMMDTKEDFRKLSGRQGYHFVISFAPGEADAETTYRIGQEFCRQYLGDGYDYVFAVHTDQHHSHCHIVFNSMNRLDGSKYRYENGDWEKYIQPLTDSLCIRHNLEPLSYDRKAKKGKTYAERRAEMDGRMTGKDIIRYDIDYAIAVSETYDAFLQNLRRQGYRIREGYSDARGIPFLTYFAPGFERGRRDYNLGGGYSLPEIRQRIASGLEFGSEPQMAYFPGRPVISNLWRGAAGRYQKAYVLRVVYAVFYHRCPAEEVDAAAVRKDLMEIEKLQEECRYLQEHHLTEEDGVRAALDRLMEKEAFCKRGVKNPADPEASAGDPVSTAGDSANLADRKEELASLRREKQILKRILRRDMGKAPVITRMEEKQLALPEEVRKILYPESETKDRSRELVVNDRSRQPDPKDKSSKPGENVKCRTLTI